MNKYFRRFFAMFITLFGSQASMTATPVAQDQDGLEWDEAKAAGTLKAFEAYLAKYPVGPHARDAFQEIIRLSDCERDIASACNSIEQLESSLFDVFTTRKIPALY